MPKRRKRVGKSGDVIGQTDEALESGARCGVGGLGPKVIRWLARLKPFSIP